MEIWYSLGAALAQECALLGWRDSAEIMFFIVVMFYWLRWLNTDKEKNLATLFFLYSLVAIGSYYYELTAISILFIGGLPLIVVIFVMLHQKSLQQNFISINRLPPPQEESLNLSWLNDLMSFALSALYKHQDIVFIIERNNNLSLLLTSSCVVQALLSKEFLELLTGPETATPTYNFWLTHTGTMVGINTSLNYPLDSTWLAEEIHHIPRWQQEALYITTKTDAIIFRGSFTTKTFTIIMEGKCSENISPQQTMTLLKRSINHLSQERITHASPPSQPPTDHLHHL